MIDFIERHEKLIIIMLSTIQTIMIVVSIWFVYFELKGKETESGHNQRAESWGVYRSNKNTTLALRQFWQSVPYNYDKKSHIRAITLHYVPIENDAVEMYTEFEMCLRADRCNEEILVELACSDAIAVTRIIYQDYGKVLFHAYNENLSNELQVNMFHFTSRCTVMPHFPSDFEWLEDYNNLVLKPQT